MKQKVTYADFVAAQNKHEGTVAWIIERFIAEMDGTGGMPAVRPLKASQRYTHKTKTLALPPEAQAMLVALWEVRDESEPRIFPYCAKSCSARHTLAKQALGFGDLRMHDSRRDCCSRLVEKGYSSQQGIMVSGHDTTAMFDKVYCRPTVAIFHEGPRNAPQ